MLPGIVNVEFGGQHSNGLLSQMKALLIVKSAVEVPTGLLLLASPSTLVLLLLGLPLATNWAIAARIAGVALLVLGAGCWVARNHVNGSDAVALAVILLVYDAIVVAALLVAHFSEGLFGVLLWPGILLHLGLAVWSILSIKKGYF
jgi:hypothetical protein